MKLNSILLGVFIGILLGAFLMNKFTPTVKLPKATHHETWKYDTIYPDPEIIEVKVKVPGPIRTYTVYADKPIDCSTVNIWSDSIVDPKLNIYYTDSVRGLLLGKKMSFKLKVPLIVKVEHEVIDSIPFPVPQNGFYLSGGIGIAKTSNSLFIGADYVSNKKNSFGLMYDCLGKSVNIIYRYKLR